MRRPMGTNYSFEVNSFSLSFIFFWGVHNKEVHMEHVLRKLHWCKLASFSGLQRCFQWVLRALCTLLRFCSSFGQSTRTENRASLWVSHTKAGANQRWASWDPEVRVHVQHPLFHQLGWLRCSESNCLIIFEGLCLRHLTHHPEFRHLAKSKSWDKHLWMLRAIKSLLCMIGSSKCIPWPIIPCTNPDAGGKGGKAALQPVKVSCTAHWAISHRLPIPWSAWWILGWHY